MEVQLLDSEHFPNHGVPHTSLKKSPDTLEEANFLSFVSANKVMLYFILFKSYFAQEFTNKTCERVKEDCTLRCFCSY